MIFSFFVKDSHAKHGPERIVVPIIIDKIDGIDCCRGYAFSIHHIMKNHLSISSTGHAFTMLIGSILKVYTCLVL